jgi:hypothetical protein
MTSMKKPNAENIEARVPIQIKTMFYTEGNPAGLLVENRAGKHTERLMPFKNAHAALSWCQSKGCSLFYTATNIVNS